MLGAIAGDIIGSVFEYQAYKGKPLKSTKFPLFSEKSRVTDDSVMTVAVADAILHNKPFAPTLKQYGRLFPQVGYGGMFKKWLKSDDDSPYNSFGNGSAMRVSPAGFAADSRADCLGLAKKSAEATHNHPEGIKGAQAVALAIFLARKGHSKEEIKTDIAGTFSYDLDRRLDDIRPAYKFDVTCQGSVPEALLAFFESADFESSIRLAVSLGGDTDTQAAMTGGVAQAFYKKIPDKILSPVLKTLPRDLKEVVEEFNRRFQVEY